jgi:uncharacterized protein YgbK (DUF1537 family)
VTAVARTTAVNPLVTGKPGSATALTRSYFSP